MEKANIIVIGAYTFTPMNKKYSDEMVNNWTYGEPYSVYNFSKLKDYICNTNLWGKELFAVLNNNGELVGEFGNKFDGSYLWIGFSLKPELTGKGLGAGFVNSCVKFAAKLNNYEGKYIHLKVSEFNKRAVKVYERVGFIKTDKIVAIKKDKTTKFFIMRKLVNISI